MFRTGATLFPINLQFFAADGAGAGGTGDNGAGENGNQSQNQNTNTDTNTNTDGNNGGSGDKAGEKTFTQEDLNRVGKQEKESGRKSMLKALGFEDEESAKEAITKYNEYLESQKTEEQKKNEALTKATNDAKASEQRALRAEAKVAALVLGANPEVVDDLITLALTKVTDDKDLDTVMKEMQGNSAFSSFFNKTENEEENSKGKKGTGSNVGTGSTGSGGGSSLASRLAGKGTSSGGKKSSYFTR